MEGGSRVRQTTKHPLAWSPPMMRLACLTVFLATSALAADAKTCDRFAKTFEKAGKAVGQAPDAETVAFMKKNCGKKPEAEITKDADCLEKVKTEADLGKCMK
jgi:hypothetical protein